VAEPVFEEAWQAQAFAMVTALQQSGHVTPAEWAEALGAEIRRGGDDDYYQHWLAALERVVVEKGMMSEAELARRKMEWQEAARATPHGQPIELKAITGEDS